MTLHGEIPILRVAGSHREVGGKVGQATAGTIRHAIASLSDFLPAGRKLEQQLALAAQYRAATVRALPWIGAELDGVAAGARVDPLALFAASVEEIRAQPASTETSPSGRCSDILVTAPATADGHTLVAHTNDLDPGSEDEVVAIEWRVPGEPIIFSLGIGPWISVGWNEAGLSLTGDELSPNDERVGVPRLLMVREQLTKRTLADAVAAALRPDRASSYNTLFAHRDDGVVGVEGSATDAALITPDPAGTLIHTNHYLDERMRRYERDPQRAARSAVRSDRARELVERAMHHGGSITPELLRTVLSDHANAPDSICRHAAPDQASKTVFWCLADVTEGRIMFGRGNPCTSTAQTYTFA